MEKEAKTDPRVKRTRKLLQQAMTELIGKKRFSEITVQDITGEADVNRATFYAHFTDKYDLLNSIIRDRFQKMLDEKLPEHPLFTQANLQLLLQTVYAYLETFPGQCTTHHLHNDHGLMVQQVQIQVYTVLIDWFKRTYAGGGQVTSSCEVIAMTISWAIFGPILQTSWGHKKIPSTQLMDEIMTILQFGLKDYMLEEALTS